jgi:3-deoxy-manno-octulosonate cytidylyltransferase (CMP-KDO synthetase)
VLIPARLESTRLPRKLLLAETGRPLLAHTVERALAAKEVSEGAIGRVIVAADDERLCEVARAAGAEGVLTRTDHASGTDRIAEVAATIEEQLVVNVQGDEPEVETAHVLAAARLLQIPAHDDDPMGTLAYPITDEAAFRNPNLVKVVLDHDGRALYFSRAPVPFPREGTLPGQASDVARTERKDAWGLAHIGLYVYRRDFLLRYSSLPASALEEREKLEQLRALEAGERIRVAVVDPPRGAPVDTREGYEAFCRRAGSDGT